MSHDEYDPYRDPDSDLYDPYSDPDSGMYDPYLDSRAPWSPDYPKDSPGAFAEIECFIEDLGEGKCVETCYDVNTMEIVNVNEDAECPEGSPLS